MVDKIDKSQVEALNSEEYKYGFHDKDVSVFKTEKGINEQVVREISAIKHEPEWMLEKRLEAYHYFMDAQNPN